VCEIVKAGASTPAKAIRYALNGWSGLVLFLEDGRRELETLLLWNWNAPREAEAAGTG
jgi:hypothetical protein